MFIIVNDGYLSLASPPDIIILPSSTKYNLPKLECVSYKHEIVEGTDKLNHSLVYELKPNI